MEEIAKSWSIIFEKSWESGEDPCDWKRRNITPILKNGKKVKPGNYKPVSLTTVPDKVMGYTEAVEIKELVCDSQLCGVSTGR